MSELADPERLDPEQFTNCIEFTTDHRQITDETDVFGAAICPSSNCQHPNPLTGDDPHAFADTVLRCMACSKVFVLDAEALERFISERMSE